MPKVIPPRVTNDDAFFWDGVAQDRLLVRRCAECSYLQHPPTPMCPRCNSVEWTVQEVSGRGEVYSWVVSKHPNDPDDPRRIVSVIALEEGIRLVANLAGVPEPEVRPGLAVRVTFAELDGVRLPQFVAAGSTPGGQG